jgi:hypothetical protein
MVVTSKEVVMNERMLVWLGATVLPLLALVGVAAMIAARALGGVTVATALLGGLGLATTLLATGLGAISFGKVGA